MNTKDYLKRFVEFDKKYKFKPDIDDNILSVQALREVYIVIRDYCNELNKQNDFYIDLPNTVNLYTRNPNDDWNKWRDDNGRTWVKRYRDYVREISGITLPPSLLGQIGETCARVKGTSSKTWVFDFHAGIDWQPGEFGEKEGSCLWTDYDLGRRLANEQGVCAIRFYQPKGRALLWLTSDRLLHIFNLYHDYRVERESVAKMLAEFLEGDWVYTNCMLESEDLFINGDTSTALFDSTVSRDEIYSCHTLTLEKVIDGITMCAECYQFIPVEKATMTHYNRYVCQECLSRYTQCKDCGDWWFSRHIDDGICMYCGEELPF